MTRQHLEPISDAELAEMARPANPGLSRVVEALQCLDNAKSILLTLSQLDETNARSIDAMRAELQSVLTELARFEMHYRQAVAT